MSSTHKLSLLLLALLSAIELRAATRDYQPPNIILILVDDLGHQELGCYGQEKIQTPNIDRLAAEGMRFTQFYSGSAVCAPARCNLLTGKHAGNAYIRNNFEIQQAPKGRFGGQLPLPSSEPNIAKTLKASGYTTGCFGKWGLGAQGSSGDPLQQGFDQFYGYNCQRNAHNLYPTYLEDNHEIQELSGNTRGLTGQQYAPQLIADRMLEFVSQSKERPFFLYYPTVLPHLPLQIPEEYLEAYRGKWEETPHTGKSYLPHPEPRAAYAAMISFMDQQVGRLMHLLEELGIDDNTLIIFTSDNGTTFLKTQVDYDFFQSVGDLNGLKGSLHDGGIRIPCIARWPGKIAAGTTNDMMAAHYDLPATLSEVAGTSFAPDTDGISLLPALTGKPQQTHNFLFWDFAGYGGQIALRYKNWKGIKRDMHKNPQAKLELYDLSNDPNETTNLAAKFPEVVAKIDTIIAKERKKPATKKFQFGPYSQ